MTHQKTVLRLILAKGTDAIVLREMIGFAAERPLMRAITTDR